MGYTEINYILVSNCRPHAAEWTHTCVTVVSELIHGKPEYNGRHPTVVSRDIGPYAPRDVETRSSVASNAKAPDAKAPDAKAPDAKAPEHQHPPHDTRFTGNPVCLSNSSNDKTDRIRHIGRVPFSERGPRSYAVIVLRDRASATFRSRRRASRRGAMVVHVRSARPVVSGRTHPVP